MCYVGDQDTKGTSLMYNSFIEVTIIYLLISPIHNHDESHCVMKFLSGSLKETRYEKPEGVGPPVKEHSCTVLKTDDVAYINGTFIALGLP